MKYATLFLLTLCLASSAIAQSESTSSHVLIQINGDLGKMSQTFHTDGLTADYLNKLNDTTSGFTLYTKNYLVIDGSISYFFGKKKRLGVGAGCLFQKFSTDLEIGKFRVEYQSVDDRGNTFRQILTARSPITESVKTSIVSIPVFLKYQLPLRGKFSCMIEAGAYVTISSQNKYEADGSFDYEAIYKFVRASTGADSCVFDNSPTPASNSWQITSNLYNGAHSASAIRYMDSLYGKGFNVGLDKPISDASKKGEVTLSTSLGLMIRPQITYRITNLLTASLGFFLTYQGIKHADDTYILTNKPGEYRSILNAIKNGTNISYGGSLGVGIWL